MEPRRLGRRLAERHVASPADPDGEGILDFEERPRTEDWTMRSALVRYALPEPARAGAVLHVVRRLNATLSTARRVLESATVRSDPSLADLELDTDDLDVHPPAGGTADIRIADLARLARRHPHEADAIIDGYVEVTPLDPAEQVALPLVMVALDLDDLADTLAAWAPTAPAAPPNQMVDHAIGVVTDALDRLGVPEETGPPPRGRSRGRG